MEKQNFGFGMMLDVPYANKDKVKAAGARWNGDLKYWYCPSNISDISLNIIIELKENKELNFANCRVNKLTSKEIKFMFIDYQGIQAAKPIFKKQILFNAIHSKADVIDIRKRDKIYHNINFDSDSD